MWTTHNLQLSLFGTKDYEDKFDIKRVFEAGRSSKMHEKGQHYTPWQLGPNKNNLKTYIPIVFSGLVINARMKTHLK